MAGIDGHAGTTFRNITRGETVPMSFTFKEADGVTPIDVTGWKVYVAFAAALGGDVPDLEIVLNPSDALGGVFVGEISDTETLSLPAGLYYASAKYIKADGRTYLIDKAKISFFDDVSARIEQ